MGKALIFDFDGVLVLSEKARFDALQDLLKKHNVSLSNNDLNHMVGKTTTTFLNNFLKHKGEEFAKAMRTKYETEYKENVINKIQPIPTTTDFIKTYNGKIPFAVASMSSQKAVESTLKRFGIFSKFSSIICRDKVTHNKPDPEIYLKSSHELNIAPQDCMVIEDSIIGVRSAVGAGMKCYVLLNGLNKQDEFKDFHVAGFLQTQEDIDKIIT